MATDADFDKAAEISLQSKLHKGLKPGMNPAESPVLLARLAAAWNRLTDADRAGVVELAENLAGG